jgi:hypothetical protein
VKPNAKGGSSGVVPANGRMFLVPRELDPWRRFVQQPARRLGVGHWIGAFAGPGGALAICDGIDR